VPTFSAVRRISTNQLEAFLSSFFLGLALGLLIG
jgi:hypothetical protein